MDLNIGQCHILNESSPLLGVCIISNLHHSHVNLQICLSTNLCIYIWCHSCVVFQIIERLPTKSLVKFKALSTRFCSIIDELLRARGSEDDQGGGDFQTELDLLEDVQTPSVSGMSLFFLKTSFLITNSHGRQFLYHFCQSVD